MENLIDRFEELILAKSVLGDVEEGGAKAAAAADVDPFDSSIANNPSRNALIAAQHHLQLSKLRSYFHKDVRKQLYSEEDDMAFFNRIKTQVKQVRSRHGQPAGVGGRGGCMAAAWSTCWHCAGAVASATGVQHLALWVALRPACQCSSELPAPHLTLLLAYAACHMCWLCFATSQHAHCRRVHLVRRLRSAWTTGAWSCSTWRCTSSTWPATTRARSSARSWRCPSCRTRLTRGPWSTLLSALRPRRTKCCAWRWGAAGGL